MKKKQKDGTADYNVQPIVIPSANLAQTLLLHAALSIKEGNELIAKFMGGNKQIIPKGGLYGYKEGTELWMSVFSSNPLSYLCFNDEWDWIMPVVERIESKGYTFKICRNRVEIDIDGEHHPFPMILCKDKTKILSVWKGCIEFIRVCPKGSEKALVSVWASRHKSSN